MKLRMIITEDGSVTLYHADLLETYHSLRGALDESRHVYIEAGLKFAFSQKKHLKILEVGFGTGLNVMLTLDFLAENPNFSADFLTLEPHPVPPELVSQLNYPQFFPKNAAFFAYLHEIDWAVSHQILPNFVFRKEKLTLLECPTEKYDLIYFDAFAPNKQADIWDEKNMEKIAELSQKGTVLVTYCSANFFRKNLEKQGFEIEKLKGSKGKREMTRAIR